MFYIFRQLVNSFTYNNQIRKNPLYPQLIIFKFIKRLTFSKIQFQLSHRKYPADTTCNREVSYNHCFTKNSIPQSRFHTVLRNQLNLNMKFPSQEPLSLYKIPQTIRHFESDKYVNAALFCLFTTNVRPQNLQSLHFVFFFEHRHKFTQLPFYLLQLCQRLINCTT